MQAFIYSVVTIVVPKSFLNIIKISKYNQPKMYYLHFPDKCKKKLESLQKAKNNCFLSIKLSRRATSCASKLYMFATLIFTYRNKFNYCA